MLCPKCSMEIQANVKFCPKCGEKLEQSPMEIVLEPNVITKNDVWPEWQLEENPIGKGSYGAVYKAVRRDNNVESHAAIKIISIPLDSSEVDSLRSEGLDMNATRTYLQGLVNDFVSEIQLMESLKGVQNIVSVEDYKVVEKRDEIGWDIYIRMELLTPFNTYIRDKKMTEEDVIKLGYDICTALEICDKRNIIHRDIKPENIFINDFGHFKLGDFGIARKMENVTGGLSQKGTFNYMAPEITTNNDYDSRVDTYSLGIVLYRLLNGNRLPFLDSEQQLLNPNERRNAVDRRIRGEALPAPCEASPEMADVILRACAFNPSARFSSATEMKQALMNVVNGTYQMAASNLDRTTSVLRAPDDLDKTTSVRKAPVVSEKKSAPVVETFGAKPKKKKKMPAMIVALLAAALLVGAGIFVVPKLIGDKDSIESGEISGSTTSETVDYSKFDEEQIASIIEEAETLASEEDYEGALVKVQTGLVTYPKSADLQNKADEYTEAMNAQIKEKTLAEAKSLADSGDYVGALQTVNQAMKSVGDDKSLTTAAKTYEEAYVNNISTQVEECTKTHNFQKANTLLSEALSVLPQNETLTSLQKQINDYQLSLTNLQVEPIKENVLQIDYIEIQKITDKISIEGEKKTYTVNSTEAGTYRFEFSEVPNNVQFTLFVYNSNMEQLRKEYDRDNGDGITMDLKENTTYYVVVEQENSTGSYTLNIGIQKTTQDVSLYTKVYDSIQYTGQRNIYSYCSTEAGTYRFEFSEVPNNVQFTLFVYNSNMEQLEKEYDRDNGDGITMDLKENTTYYVVVEQENFTGSYALNIGAQKAHKDITNCTTVSDSTQFTDQRNYYTITPELMGTYNLSLSTSGNAQYTIYIYNAYMEELGKKHDCKNGSNVEFALNANLTYYIVVEQEDNTGTYTLIINK